MKACFLGYYKVLREPNNILWYSAILTKTEDWLIHKPAQLLKKNGVSYESRCYLLLLIRWDVIIISCYTEKFGGKNNV